MNKPYSIWRIRGFNRRVEAWDQQVLDPGRNRTRSGRGGGKAWTRERKPKINRFDVNATVDDFITPRPATYALIMLNSSNTLSYGMSLKKVPRKSSISRRCLRFCRSRRYFCPQITLSSESLSQCYQRCRPHMRLMTMGRICFLQHPPGQVEAPNFPSISKSTHK